MKKLFAGRTRGRFAGGSGKISEASGRISDTNKKTCAVVADTNKKACAVFAGRNKKICAVFAAAVTGMGIALFSGCAGKVDYTEYISEKRSQIFIYEDDEVKFSLYCVAREQPFNADGICGDMCDLTEISAVYAHTPENVFVQIGQARQEMNYDAVKKGFELSYTAPPVEADGIDIVLEADGNEKKFRALGVRDRGVISCEQAVEYAAEYDSELFASLTSKNRFAGEIYVRLLYDEGCYYYVGVCDRQKNITAYLLDGGVGKVIATKKLHV